MVAKLGGCSPNSDYLILKWHHGTPIKQSRGLWIQGWPKKSLISMDFYFCWGKTYRFSHGIFPTKKKGFSWNSSLQPIQLAMGIHQSPGHPAASLQRGEGPETLQRQRSVFCAWDNGNSPGKSWVFVGKSMVQLMDIPAHHVWLPACFLVFTYKSIGVGSFGFTLKGEHVGTCLCTILRWNI